MSSAFSLKDISKAYGDDTLFENLTIDFPLNERLGLIGMNGSGKSTLLKIIAGETVPDEGERIIKSGLNFIYLPQDDVLTPELTIEQTLYKALESSNFDEKLIHKTVQQALGKGGFKDPDILCKNLSGGLKKRLAIIRALCCKPDILLLDEPTNHLDINGILWLEDILKNARFSFILVSHDRSFLNNVCNNIIEIGRYYPSGYLKINGDYSMFEKQRNKFLAAQIKQQASLSNKMRREKEWLSHGPKARTSKAKFRIEQANVLREQVDQIKKRNRITTKVDLDFHATGRKTKKLIRAFELGKSMDKNILFSDITFEIGPGFCLGIVGANGSGKSTFLSILEQKILPDKGKVTWAQDLKIAVFDQNRSKLNPEATLKDALNPAGTDSVNYKGRNIHVVSWAKRFLFMPDQLEMPVKQLSGGEKARILLANIMLSPCDILLLDEPTNDLDIFSLEVLEESIKQFQGGVIIVSHDRYLMDRICNRLLYLNPEQESRFFKDFDQIIKYRNSSIVKPEKTDKKSAKQKNKTPINFSYKDKFELDHIEEKIQTSETEVETLTSKIQDPDIINNREKMAHYCLKLEQAQASVSELYDRWDYLEQKKEMAEKHR